ncbi:putative sodium- and chloride-dependent glycine transporter 1 [Penaeus vannamei]|uniref:Putative sodium-and chloride-dependent glycine transporter 1 n=1 Tax=Penaeus vannamei TaxID=6689 RepID=A0A3R7PKG8_PENVA|nr:putative sodium- and chloride-dependent glycine transporter 1 [Penaeus vannamei]
MEVAQHALPQENRTPYHMQSNECRHRRSQQINGKTPEGGTRALFDRARDCARQRARQPVEGQGVICGVGGRLIRWLFGALVAWLLQSRASSAGPACFKDVNILGLLCTTQLVAMSMAGQRDEQRPYKATASVEGVAKNSEVLTEDRRRQTVKRTQTTVLYYNKSCISIERVRLLQQIGNLSSYNRVRTVGCERELNQPGEDQGGGTKGESSGKVVYFTALFPYAVLLILFIRGVTLEGAYKGVEFYLLRPNISRLGEIEVWNDAATQIFYSLGSSFGGLITLASYNKFKNNCMRDAIIIAFSNCSTSVFAGFVIFSILGFLATELGVEVQDVVSSGSGLAFVVYPAAVTRMPVSPLWAILFFAMLITLGLDSQFTMVETLSTALFDQFESLRSRKPLVVFSVCFGLFLAGLTMCLEGGIYMFELFNWYSAGLSVIILAITEIVVVQYFYGFKNFMRNIREEMNIYMPLPLYGYWAATWLVITPVSLGVIFLMSIYYFVPAYWGDYTYPGYIQTLGWFICVSSIIFIPLGAVYAVWKGDKRGSELIKASPDFCPHHIRKLRESKGAAAKGHPEGVFRYTYDNEGYQEGAAKVYPTIPTEDVPPPYSNGSSGYSNHM